MDLGLRGLAAFENDLDECVIVEAQGVEHAVSPPIRLLSQFGGDVDRFDGLAL